jgi:ribosomal protein S20
MRSDAKKAARNLAVKTRLKTLYRRLTLLTKKGSKDLETKARELVSLFDKAVSQGIIHKGKANRKKARIANLLSKKS